MLSLLPILLLVGAPQSAETLTNDTIVQLTSVGLGDEAIIAKIKGTPTEFKLSTDDMIALKGKGVSGPVIAAMLGAHAPAPTISVDALDPMTPHMAGVYLVAPSKMLRMDATATNQAKTGGILGFALTGGIASMSVKASVSNETSRYPTVDRKPVFYFFFDESNGGTAQGSTWLAGSASVVTSPNEFTLIHLDKKKGRREARVGSRNIGGMKTGVMDKDRIEFDYELVRTGVYRAVSRAPLEPGEYGFIYSVAGSGANGALSAKIYDFTVTGSGKRGTD
ncbi:hypothetical protein IAG41_00225 [Sphingomonas sp. JC676]|uniref:hypothetical protein n=1 Tax=Sphingomonas sp. JC676 TaxID=2768065 RepID=UPI0016585E1E|nr:hypothetical protein [Sphingomonas sp. JC676]MBC9030807.1 hypothetical protein [Sphingomonas sp. JC676]